MTRRVRVARAYESAELALRVVSLAVELASLGVLTYLSVVFWYDHATNPIAYVGTTIALLTDAAELFTLATLNCAPATVGICGLWRPPTQTTSAAEAAAAADESALPESEPDNGWPQARLAWVALGDVTSAVLLFFSWIWLITRGMFWSCLVEGTTSGDGGSGLGSGLGGNGGGGHSGGSSDGGVMITRSISRLLFHPPLLRRTGLSESDASPAVYANCDGADYPGEALQHLSWVLPFVMAALHLIAVMVYCSALQRRVFATGRPLPRR